MVFETISIKRSMEEERSSMKIIASTIHQDVPGAVTMLWTYSTPTVDERMARSKRQEDPNKPKKASTPFMFFVKAKRREVADEIKDTGPATDVLKVVLQRWRGLDDKAKEPYIQEAALDKARHENELRNIPEITVNINADGLAAGQSNEPRPKKKRKKRDPNKPKKAATPYTCFVKAKRKEVAMQLGNKGPATDVLKTVARLWREMGTEDREPYDKLAETDKMRYEKEMQSYSSQIEQGLAAGPPGAPIQMAAIQGPNVAADQVAPINPPTIPATATAKAIEPKPIASSPLQRPVKTKTQIASMDV